MSRAKDNASISSRLRSDVGALVTSDSDSLETLEVGADGYVLTADSSNALGIKWAAAGSSGLSAGQITDLTDAGDSTLHYHATDRDLSSATGTLAVSNGGTGQTTVQAAINALTAVSAASAGQVLTKSGSDATWVSPAGAGLGDVSTTGSAVASNLVAYNDTSGDVIKDSGIPLANVADKASAQTFTNKTMSTGSTWAGTKIGPTVGGTDQTSWTKGDVLYASATNTLSKLPIGSVGQTLQVSSAGTPSWSSDTGGGIGATNNEYTFPGVADFVQGPGAVFVSGTDNTAAIVAAAASGKPIYFPKGNYYAASWSAVYALLSSKMAYGPGLIFSPYGGKIMNVGKTLMIGSTNSGHRSDYAGGIVIGGERDGNGLLHWVGHHNWMQINATRPGVGTQWQIFPNTYNGLARCSAADTLTATYGDFPSDLLVEDTIAWDGKLYKIASKTGTTQITIKDWITGGATDAVVNNTYDGTNYTGERMWTVSWETATGTCNVSGNIVTWVSGDHYPYGVPGDQMYAIINGTRYTVTEGPETTGGFTLTLSSFPGTLTNATLVFRRQYGPWAYNSLIRLQGLIGGKETNCGLMLNSRNDAVLWNNATQPYLIGKIRIESPKIRIGGGENYPFNSTTDNYGIEVVSPTTNGFGDRFVRLGGYDGKEALKVVTWGGYTDHLTLYGSVSGVNNGPSIAAEGSSSNLDISLIPKGSGYVSMGTKTSTGDAAINGYITIKDAAGNLVKLATVA